MTRAWDAHCPGNYILSHYKVSYVLEKNGSLGETILNTAHSGCHCVDFDFVSLSIVLSSEWFNKREKLEFMKESH